jgi:hypothetical protein
MTEIILGVIIVILLAERAYRDRLDRAERKTFVHALKAKNAYEMKELTVAERAKPESLATPPVDQEFTHESDVPDYVWEKAIKQEILTEEEEEKENG